MTALLTLALSYPTVVFTVLLAVVLVYWVVVLVGAAGIDLLGGGHDGALDGHGGLDHGGMDHGGVDGGGHDGGGHDGGDGGDGDGHGGDGDAGGSHSLGSALRLRSAPVTVVASLIITFGWLACVTMEQSAIGAWAVSWPLRTLVILAALVVAVLATSVAIRPIAKLFVTKKATGNSDLVGKVCRVRTGTADDAFGEATLEDGGAGLVLRVRTTHGTMRRGEEAVIVAWDAEREVFTVAPLEEPQPPPAAS
jgi:hypothetical protein